MNSFVNISIGRRCCDELSVAVVLHLVDALLFCVFVKSFRVVTCELNSYVFILRRYDPMRVVIDLSVFQCLKYLVFEDTVE